MRRNSTQEAVEEAKEAYYGVRKRYKRAIRCAKLQTWGHFVSEVGNEEPWGIVYRILRDKNPKREAYHSVTLNTGERTLDWRETAERILEILLPADGDPLSTDHIGIARIAREYENHHLAPPFTGDEVNVTVCSLKSGKAPGPDLIEVEVLKRLWKAAPAHLLSLYNGFLHRSEFPSTWKVARLCLIYKGEEKTR